MDLHIVVSQFPSKVLTKAIVHALLGNKQTAEVAIFHKGTIYFPLNLRLLRFIGVSKVKWLIC